MFEAIRRLLSGETRKSGNAPAFADTDPRVAVAALLVHTIAIDGQVDAEETARVRELLAERYQLTSEQTEQLLKAASHRDREAVDLYGFTSVIKAEFDADRRMEVVEMLWEMVYADGELHEFEDNLVWRVAELLGISTRDRVTLRKRVEERLKS